MTRSEEEFKTLVKRAAKARTDHPTLSVPEAMRVATFTLEESSEHVNIRMSAFFPKIKGTFGMDSEKD